jgi:hypothetical protein
LRLAVLGNRTKRREKEEAVMRSVSVATYNKSRKTPIVCTLVARIAENRFI